MNPKCKLPVVDFSKLPFTIGTMKEERKKYEGVKMNLTIEYTNSDAVRVSSQISLKKIKKKRKNTLNNYSAEQR